MACLVSHLSLKFCLCVYKLGLITLPPSLHHWVSTRSIVTWPVSQSFYALDHHMTIFPHCLRTQIPHFQVSTRSIVTWQLIPTRSIITWHFSHTSTRSIITWQLSHHFPLLFALSFSSIFAFLLPFPNFYALDHHMTTFPHSYALKTPILRFLRTQSSFPLSSTLHFHPFTCNFYILNQLVIVSHPPSHPKYSIVMWAFSHIQCPPSSPSTCYFSFLLMVSHFTFCSLVQYLKLRIFTIFCIYTCMDS